MRRQCFIAVSLLLVFSFISLNIVSSQSGQSGQFGQFGTLTGTVKDPSGSVVAGAPVTVRSEATGFLRDTVTNKQAQYKVDKIQPGRYKVTALLSGFEPAPPRTHIEQGHH